MYSKLLKYQKLTRQAFDVMSELVSEAEEFAEENRTIKKGDVVDIICSESGQAISEGVVGRCRSLISSHLQAGQSTILLSQFEENKEIFYEDFNILRYEVFSKKRNGAASKKHLFQHPHFIVFEYDCNKLSNKRKHRFEYFIRLKK